MAEIRVEEKRRNLGWLWALIALVIVVLLIWFFMAGADDEVEPIPPAGTEPGMSLVEPRPPALPLAVA